MAHWSLKSLSWASCAAKNLARDLAPFTIYGWNCVMSMIINGLLHFSKRTGNRHGQTLAIDEYYVIFCQLYFFYDAHKWNRPMAWPWPWPHIWDTLRQSEVSVAWISNHTAQVPVLCDYLSMQQIPHSGTTCLICGSEVSKELSYNDIHKHYSLALFALICKCIKFTFDWLFRSCPAISKGWLDNLSNDPN